jgi:hypothetical protein
MRMRAAIRAAAAVVAVVAMPAATRAQRPSSSKWEIEIHGGLATWSASADGASRLPPAGSTQTTTVFVDGQPRQVNTRLVPSWVFGDGPVLFNQIFSPPPEFRLVPLDAMLGRSITTPAVGGSIGVRVSRRLTTRFSAEFSYDRNVRTIQLSSDAPAQIETSRASFEKAWGPVVGLFGPTAFATAGATLTRQAGRESLMSGTLLVDVGGRPSVLPYVAIGAGAVRTQGPLPSAQLTGDYRFRLEFPPGFPLPPSVAPVFRDVDSVTVTRSAGTVAAGVFGGGARFALSRNTGIRVDIRDTISRDARTTILTADPTSSAPTLGAFGSFVLIGTNPVLQIGSADGAPATLSDTSVASFETFRARGLSHHVNLSTGLYFRF